MPHGDLAPHLEKMLVLVVHQQVNALVVSTFDSLHIDRVHDKLDLPFTVFEQSFYMRV